MNKAFMKLAPEKRKNIIDTAILEFAEKGYRVASTDNICQQAGISKGILFYYFKSKKSLFLFVLNHAMDLILEKMLQRIQKMQTLDIFERAKEMALIKVNVSVSYPEETELIIKAFSEFPASMKTELQQAKAKQFQLVKKWRQEYLYNYFDPTVIRDGIDIETSLAYIEAIFNQIGQKYLLLYKDREWELLESPELMTDELDQYIDIIKYGIFKHD